GDRLGHRQVLTPFQAGGGGAVEDPLHGGAEGREERAGEHLAVVDDVEVEDRGGADAEQPLRVPERSVRQQLVRLALRYGEDHRVGAEGLAGNLDAPAPVLLRGDGGDPCTDL